VAGVLELLASPFNCIYSAAKLKSSPNYPAREIMGSGAFELVEHVQGSHWIAKRFEGYFKPGRPYLDGYKAYFVKSPAVVPGLLGGQFDAEFRFRTPPERDSLIEKLGSKVAVYQQPLLAGNIIIFNTRKKPFDDIRVRQALTLAIDRWTGGENIGKISSLRYPGGVSRPGSKMALPEEELAKLPGYWKDAEAARTEARRLLKEAGQENLAFKFLNRAGIESYTTGGIYAVDQWRRIGVTAEHAPLETKLWFAAMEAGDFDVVVQNISDFADDPTAQFNTLLSKHVSGIAYSRHGDTKLDELFTRQSQIVDKAERMKVVNAFERHALETAYNVPLLWYQRIVVNHKKVKGWHLTPSHFTGQNLVEVWLDE
jgi:peptide/nickel transport system substrate-binding protein